MTRALRLLTVAFLLSLSTATTAQTPAPSWTQWGGPTRDFMAPSTGLASVWPDTGPRRLWTRPLGEGHSAILFENGRLYTQYRPLADAAQPGRSHCGARCGHRQDHLGASLPLAHRRRGLHRGRRTARHAADRRQPGVRSRVAPRVHGARQGNRQGAVVARSDQGYRAPDVDRGMANSPLLFNNTIILPIGGRGRRSAAFNPDTGGLLWKGRPRRPTHRRRRRDRCRRPATARACSAAIASPASIRPTARELWSHPHQHRLGIQHQHAGVDPIRSSAAVLVRLRHRQPRAGIAAGRGQDDGHRGLGGQCVRVHIGSIIRIGDTAYMSSGDFGPAFLTAVNVEDRRNRVAGSRLRARAIALRRQQTDPAR